MAVGVNSVAVGVASVAIGIASVAVGVAGLAAGDASVAVRILSSLSWPPHWQCCPCRRYDSSTVWTLVALVTLT